jgi:hypothetical protein
MIALTMLGCDNGDTKVDKAWDCKQICDKAKTCVGGDDFDLDKCKSECRSDAEDDQVDECESCLDDKDSCTTAAKCTVECGGVLAATVFQ